jgi:hypothetical protein
MSSENKLLKTRPRPELPPPKTPPPRKNKPYFTESVRGKGGVWTGGGGLGGAEDAADYQGDPKSSVPEVTVTDAGHNGGRPIMNDPEIMMETDPAIAPTPLSAPGDPKREQMHPGKRRK